MLSADFLNEFVLVETCNFLTGFIGVLPLYGIYYILFGCFSILYILELCWNSITEDKIMK
jgi:hypothetical protein